MTTSAPQSQPPAPITTKDDGGTDDPRTCTHPSFNVQAMVDRRALQSGRIGAFTLSVSLHCESCKLPFWFPGMGTGVSYVSPVTNPAGDIAALPVVPLGQRCTPDASLVTTQVRTGDGLKGRRAS